MRKVHQIRRWRGRKSCDLIADSKGEVMESSPQEKLAHTSKQDGEDASPEEGRGNDHQAKIADSDLQALPTAAAPSNPAAQQEEENEFILDGFDFSTGVSICKALDLDDDDEDEQEGGKRGSLPPSAATKGMTDPSELLRKAIGMTRGGGGGGPNTEHKPSTGKLGSWVFSF